MNTPQLLTDSETCLRKGYWERSWQPQKLNSTQMTLEAIREGLTSFEGDSGEAAGAAMLQLATDRGLERSGPEVSGSHRTYPSVIHHAALADLVVSTIRKKDDQPWLVAPPVLDWTSACFISQDGLYLRRLVLVSSWSDDRHFSEVRSWFSLGEIAHYNLPMQMVVVNIGRQRDGLRIASPWTTGFRHPLNRTLRFRKRESNKAEVFGKGWEKIYREDHAEISRETWLNAMLKDDVLYEVCFRVDIPIPPIPHLQRARQMAAAKLERLYALKDRPEANFSTCDWPVPCPFRKLCHVVPEMDPEAKYGFVSVEALRDHDKAVRPTAAVSL